MTRALPLLLLLVGCPQPTPAPTDLTDDTDVDTEALPDRYPIDVLVTLDGEPAPDVLVSQGGVNVLYRTDGSGRVTFDLDLTLDAEWYVIASHPQARQTSRRVYDPRQTPSLELGLTSYDPADNPEYVFQDPGTPDRRDTTAQCAHCHNTLNDDWYASPHRSSASNPHVQDVYAGVASAYDEEATCTAAGGTWASGVEPGTGAPIDRCYLGSGTLPDLDPSCAPNCDGRTEVTGACADCHAPGIDGPLGDRDLLEATGLSYEAGVHCDVCHKVESVDLASEDPGVSGRLVVHRPSEPDDLRIAGPWIPIQFGPHHDSPNPRMGSVQRDHYKNAEICSGCHQYDQPVLLPGVEADTARWPDGRLPVHSTWEEWKAGPFGDKVPCNACHMPPAPEEWNGANLQDFDPNDVVPGLAGGWIRPPGAVRHHSWVGPRTPVSRMLQLAAAVDLETRIEEGALVVEATTSNIGAGHRLPTGEPSRQVVLHVEARCEGEVLDAIGGDAIPPWVGAIARKDAGEDWTVWPSASVGDTIRVVRQEGWRSDPGFGPFGDGTFTPEQAGNARWSIAGVRTITAVTDGGVTLDAALPEGDLALLGPPLAPPSGTAGPAAGAPGHAFARVLSDPDGRTGVPHHAASDVVLDNRLAPYEKVTTTHRFAASCEAPTARAWLTWRAHPWSLATEKGWSNDEAVMVEVSR